MLCRRISRLSASDAIYGTMHRGERLGDELGSFRSSGSHFDQVPSRFNRGSSSER
jgi:hypothetical protein